MPNDKHIERLFSYLNESRHLPNFRLEPQVAPFFALALPSILSGCLKGKPRIHDTIVPEFPVQHVNGNRADHVDYLAFRKNKGKVYFVELKTDVRSFKSDHGKKQQQMLIAAKKRRFRAIVDGVKDLAKCKKKNTEVRRKYASLLFKLAKSPYEPDEDSVASVIEWAFKKGRGFKHESLNEAIDSLDYFGDNPTIDPEIEVVYILPSRPEDSEKRQNMGFNYITFDDAANELKKTDDSIFACYLGEWEVAPATDRPDGK